MQPQPKPEPQTELLRIDHLNKVFHIREGFNTRSFNAVDGAIFIVD
jgi:hypothetical protein